jgi:acetyl esterase/lipase
MFLMASSQIASPQVNQSVVDRKVRFLQAGDTIGDLLRHPAFDGFARKLLPWDDRVYDEQMKLNAIGTLLPYHTHVDVASAVQALNRLIGDASDGRQIHFDIYTDAERREQAAKSNTGLFYYRGRAGAPFAIIAAGGGFAYVGSVHEGFPYAADISRAGFNAFVLKYRVGQGEAVAVQDLAGAITFVFRNAQALGVSTRGYSLWGSSAGARMAASIGSHGASRFGGGNLPKPSAVVMAYTGHSDVSDDEPPTFAVVGALDSISPPRVMERRIDALRRMGTEVAYRVFERVGHGFGPGLGTTAEGWIEEAIRFWQRHQPR